MRKYKSITVGLIITVLISAVSFYSQRKVIEDKVYSKNELQEDFLQAVEAIKTYHSNFYIKEEQLDSYAKEYIDAIVDDDVLFFSRILSEFLEKIGCGHSYIELSGRNQKKYFEIESHHIPLDLFVVNDKLFVKKSVSTASIPVGAEILSINGLSGKAIIETLLNRIGSDGRNKAFKYAQMSTIFSWVYFDLVDNQDKYQVTYKTKDNQIVIEEIEAVSRQALNVLLNYGDMDAESIGIEFFDTYAVLTIDHFNYYKPNERQVFYEKLDAFFSDVDALGLKNLILDIQENDGGDPFSANYLYSYISPNSYQYFSKKKSYHDWYHSLYLSAEPKKNNFKGNIYTLTGGRVFSTGAHLASLIKQNNIGPLIGSETGGSYRCSSYAQKIVLRNTNLKLIISTKIYETLSSKLKEVYTITPDYVVNKTVSETVKGINMARMKAIILISQQY
ncbi:S41 family peptidase [Vibrio sp. DW001]|uniref:S41 family peptidase n=1 Tax=Vibrio sp. DW001 TaxID=2912315 RepID=UPI0023B0C04F|nr:S41 family peptidase [Vibrio sp. DW001]WED29667.1 S41 family peptidase [Vibrio sp. DW001]